MNRTKWKITVVMVLLCFCAIWLAKSVPLQEEEQYTSAGISDRFHTDEPKQLYARSAVLMDAESGRVLFGKEENQIRPMASTTKIMTCIVALEHMTDDQTITVSEEAARQPKVHLGAEEGLQFYLKDILYSMMLESHNDSAVMAAESVGGSVEAFAGMMNEKAKELGLEKTHFVTPNGLDGEDEGGVHATTAKELARIMKYCMMDSPAKEEFLEITGTREYHFRDIGGTTSYTCVNHNAFLTMMDGAVSGKTGFTADAGYCYVGALKRDDRTFIVSLLACGWPGHKEYKWSDTRKLMEYGLENYTYKNVWKDIPVKTVLVKNAGNEKNVYHKGGALEVYVAHAPDKLNVLLKDEEKVRMNVRMNHSLTAPVKKDQKAGEVLYILGENVLAAYDIRTRSGVQERTFGWCLKQVSARLFFHGKTGFISVDLH